ncbi:carbon-nitrogen hydrolase family protein [Tropicimonas isoalkanivorans]|uniref:Predicted amidohydrolase n=1 Tax=Tropicimonas isoalkanivorans TaxID=441112 RepID=A0A1I1MME7_9RHOB|nr:carbon-nitrogen hydrolase family protein [Tropicimonas isoalkanivorans]SFC86256.1 Predicted amidohydrolase [Tropicimonas isoalkanivorans]
MSSPRPFRVAAAAYPMDRLPDFAALAEKLDRWVAEAATAGADLLVFPEYAGMEAALVGTRGPVSTLAICERSADAAADFAKLCAELARTHGVHLLAGSLPTRDAGRLVNRATFHAPDGGLGWQDKQIMTPWERQNTPLEPGDPLVAFDTPFGRIGVVICYDSEFPELGASLAADVLLVPSCTEALPGHSRVRIAARARALENQCISVLAQTVGPVPDVDMIDENVGSAGVFAPPDQPFPDAGILAASPLNRPGWLFADVDPATIAETRSDGHVSLLADRPDAAKRSGIAPLRRLAVPNRP